MLAVGEEWFERQRTAHASIDALYHPKDEPGITYPCAVTLVVGKWDMIDTQQQIVRIESKDFFVSVKDYAPSPKAGDRITYVEQGSDQAYEVTIPRGRDQCWSWANRSETLRKVHTFLRAGSTTDTSALLVRAVGVSSAAAITDAEIRSTLTIDMATSRRLARTVSPSAEYIYIVIPESFGVPAITANGLPVTAWETTVRSIVFDGQASRAYRVLRSTYAVTASVRLEVA
jgi:hypothetical protein